MLRLQERVGVCIFTHAFFLGFLNTLLCLCSPQSKTEEEKKKTHILKRKDIAAYFLAKLFCWWQCIISFRLPLSHHPSEFWSTPISLRTLLVVTVQHWHSLHLQLWQDFICPISSDSSVLDPICCQQIVSPFHSSFNVKTEAGLGSKHTKHFPREVHQRTLKKHQKLKPTTTTTASKTKTKVTVLEQGC